MTHWLTRSSTIRLLWRISLSGLALLVLIGAVVDTHPHFGIDALFGFSAWFGFLACIGLIAVAKGMGLFLKRPDNYYDSEEQGRE